MVNTIVVCKTSSNAVNMSKISAGDICARLLRDLGGACPSSLGINLGSMASEDIFKWFIASILLEAGIGADITAMNTYRAIEKAGILSVEAFLETGLVGMVAVLNQSGNIRCNRKIAAKLLKTTRALKEKYGGDINRLHFFARDERDLEKKLQNLEKDINEVTISIFLKGLRGVWDKVQLPLSTSALSAAKRLGLTNSLEASTALEELMSVLEPGGIRISDLEAGLLKLDKSYCRQNRCPVCFMKEMCKNIETKEVI